MVKVTKRIVAMFISIVMIISVLPTDVFAAIPNWEEKNVVFEGTSFGTNGYYNVISKKDYVLVPGAAVESEMVLNNAEGTRRQVLHIIEVDPSNPDVSIVPGYNQIDKDVTQEEYWSHKELTEMAKYYEDNLGYNIVGGMNTDLYYDTYAPRILVYNGKDLSVKGKEKPSSSILYVFQDENGKVSCDVKAFNRTEFDNYLKEGKLLHAVSVSFGMVVKNGELVNTKELRESSSDAARSMVGVKADGTLVICMNDGRSANNSQGLSGEFEEGEVMLALGCEWAANCDGGGSSTFLTKRSGEETFTMRSVPCDGAQRPTSHGIFVTSNVGATGELDDVNIKSKYDYFAPGTTYTFEAEALDSHGYAMEMPEDAVWTLSDASFGTIESGKFVSNGKKGTVDVQVISNGNIVGSKTINVADPEIVRLSANSVTMPYSTENDVRTITLPIICKTGEAEVYYDANVFDIALSDENAGTLDGFKFTATSDTSIANVDITITYGETVLTYTVNFGKGSEVLLDFEDGTTSGLVGFEEARKHAEEKGINNSLVGSKPLAGNFSKNVISTTKAVTEAEGGHVRNGKYALQWKIDNTNANFANWTYNTIYSINDVITTYRDTANGKNPTSLGMWIYVPEEAFCASGGAGCALQAHIWVYYNSSTKEFSTEPKPGFSLMNVQRDFYFTSVSTGNSITFNSAKNTDIPESRWVYATVALPAYIWAAMNVADGTHNYSPSVIRTYVKPEIATEIKFYIDDITLDYSSAVDDRISPTIENPTYATEDVAISLENDIEINGNKVGFSATVADNSALDLTSGKIIVDGIERKAAISNGKLSSKEDVKLVAGTHTVCFEVADELGNIAKLTRTFVVAGDAVVKLSGHNDSGEASKAQSIYYADIKVDDLSKVDKLVTTLKLNSANEWETEGAIVANGFKADFEYNEISELLTVTVERDGTVEEINDNILVSIPVRVWTFDRYDCLAREYIDPVIYLNNETGHSASNNKPRVNVEVKAISGEITQGKSVSSFAGEINVATELTTISSPYHIHDEKLTVLNKAASITEEGYENRTYCETCKSVVDWGTISNKVQITHNYKIVDGQFVCSDEGCGQVYESGTGLFEMNGKTYYSIANKLTVGWQFVNDEQYYFDKNTYEGINGKHLSTTICSTSQKFYYSFTNGKLDSGVWHKMDNGTRYYYGNSHYGQGTYVIDGKTYGFDSNGYRYEGFCVIKWNPKSDYKLFEYTEEGVYVGEVYANGVYTTSNGDIYYLTNGIASIPGLVEQDGEYYFFGHGYITARRDGKYYIAASATNGLLPEGSYEFGADGKMLQGVVEDNEGIVRYYVNGKPAYAGLVQDANGDYYYISGSTNAAITNETRYITFTNGLLPEGKYSFGADGKMLQGVVRDAEGVVRYYVNGQVTYAGLVRDTDGAYYYISGSTLTAITNTTRYITFTNDLLPEGKYSFGADGKMLQGVVRDAEGVVRYYVNGQVTYAGLVRDTDGAYYYISGSTLTAITNTTRYITFTNDLLPEGKYSFGADGKMTTKQGVVKDDDGQIRYYENDVAVYAGLVQDIDGSYYYISGNTLTAITNTTRYITFTNDLLPEGTYTFGADGKLVMN